MDEMLTSQNHGLNIVFCQYRTAFQWHLWTDLMVCIYHKLIKNRSSAVVRESRIGSCGSGCVFCGKSIAEIRLVASSCYAYFYTFQI